MDRRDPDGRDEGPWYETAILYAVDVRSFLDTDADGIGDLRGLLRKLDYVQELGVSGLCLLPFYPSPLRDHGHDVADYRRVHAECGHMREFTALVREAHRRGIRVLVDFVLGHTSDQHPWFQEARHARRGSAAHRRYVWRDEPPRPEPDAPGAGAGLGGWTWDGTARAYYRYRRFPHEPELDLAQPGVRKRLVGAMRYWLARGVDGFRLEGLPPPEGSHGGERERLDPAAAMARHIREELRSSHPDCVLVAVLDAWPDDASAPCAGGQGCQVVANRAIAPRLLLALATEDADPVVDIVEQSTRALPERCVLGLMLRDHEPLSLEAVTEEEREYLLRAFAPDPRMRLRLGVRRRLAPLLDNDPARLRLAFALLLSLPGTPCLYYGDEIHMGDNVFLDEGHGLRTPMQWSGDRNGGFSGAEPARLPRPVNEDSLYGYPVTNVEAQQRNASSFLWWLRRIIALRRHHPEFARGELSWVRSSNPKVLSFVRGDPGDALLCVANLSRMPQHVELDLAAYLSRQPVELFSLGQYRVITAKSYLLSLAGHGFLWFKLEPGSLHHSCFISYSTRDQAFVDRLQEALEREGVDCYKASRDLDIGSPIREEVLRSLHGRDRVIVVLSESSLASEWVRLEVEATLARAADSGEPLLIPVRLDTAIEGARHAWTTRVRALKFCDLAGWREPERFRQGLVELLAALHKA